MKKILLLSILIPLTLTGCSLAGAKDALNTVTGSTEEHHTVIVPGYGAPVAGNPSYEDYVETVARFVEDDSNDVDSIVFTGSYSTLADVSEAEALNSYFNTVVDTEALLDRGTRVYKEECAILSWQNISNSQDVLAADQIIPGTVTVFGDINRRDKLVAFASAAFNQDQEVPETATDVLNLRFTTVEFEGFDFGDTPDETEEERQAKFVGEIAGAYD